VTLHPKDGNADQTRSLRVNVPGDYEFTVGETVEFGDEEFVVEGVQIRGTPRVPPREAGPRRRLRVRQGLQAGVRPRRESDGVVGLVGGKRVRVERSLVETVSSKNGGTDGVTHIEHRLSVRPRRGRSGVR